MNECWEDVSSGGLNSNQHVRFQKKLQKTYEFPITGAMNLSPVTVCLQMTSGLHGRVEIMQGKTGSHTLLNKDPLFKSLSHFEFIFMYGVR